MILGTFISNFCHLSSCRELHKTKVFNSTTNPNHLITILTNINCRISSLSNIKRAIDKGAGKNNTDNYEEQSENVDRFIRQAKKYLYLEKLTPTILNDMVNAVYVHAPDKSSGHRVQDVTISYNYIGILPANLLYDVMNGKAA